MEVALRRRLDGVRSVWISEEQQRAEVVFRGTNAFSPGAFREALLHSAGVEVLSIDLEACGSLAKEGDDFWLAAGRDRFLVLEAGVISAPRVCVSGSLQEVGGVHAIRVTALRPAAPRM